MTYRILLADSHWLIRKGLRSTLDHMEGIEVVGEAADVATAVEGAIDLRPDLVLIDFRLPGEGGLVAGRKIKERRRGQKVMLLSDLHGGNLVRDALRADFDGFLRKDSSEDDLFAAIRCVRSGNVYLDAELARQFVLADYRRDHRGNLHPLDCLSPRELTVFHLVAAGLTNRGAGEQVQLSHKTVEKYRASMMKKLNLKNALELQMFALELGVVNRAPHGYSQALSGTPPTV